MINFQTSPDQYKHWKLSLDGPVAKLSMDVQEDETLADGYKLKLNSYDLGVDIELADAIQRIRFEHPEVRAVVVTSLKPRIFCAGANIYMLGTSSHAFKVNFCKFTNETRCAIEDDSRHSGRRYLAALNGTASGGGYELAIACDEIYLVDDGNSAVSLPEVPLLGVLPGTGGLTRLVDKRHVRRDRADVFATRTEGVRRAQAGEWGLGHAIAPRTQFDEESDPRAVTRAEASARLAADDVLREHADHWLVREITLFWRRTLKRLDLSARTLVALITPGSCSAGTLAELALAADRSFMLEGTFEDADDDLPPAEIVLTDANCPERLTPPVSGGHPPSPGGWYAMSNGLTRLQSRFWGRDDALEAARAALGKHLLAEEASRLGLVTFTPDDIDWEDEIRLCLEERASFSPDALTGLEANYRFVGPETLETKIFGRLTAWQNWIFQRPNASGPDGALRRYGSGSRPSYDRKRV